MKHDPNKKAVDVADAEAVVAEDAADKVEPGIVVEAAADTAEVVAVIDKRFR